MTNLEPDPLEQLLDEQSDSEFGLPAFKEQKQVLANWSAQDFSDIYVRFYPHLLRHAKRYLTNHSQAEEVVQDAFLYLMTSLPEIDSEIGVLKLLKWKVRNLALDVIAANGKASFAPVDDVDLPVEHELSENLIRADEASIVSLALAKLNPRQREALIASLYEEKETVQIANQMGLSENATRQLLFRAKSAFKKALVGEAETAGMSVSQILSIAARKAAKESGKYISAASAFLLLLAVSFGVLPNLPRQAETQVSAPVAQTEVLPSEPEASEKESLANQSEVAGVAQVTPTPALTTISAGRDEIAGPKVEVDLALLDGVVYNQLVVAESTPPILRGSNEVVKIQGEQFVAYVSYSSEDEFIDSVVLEFQAGKESIYAVASEFGASQTESPYGANLTFSGTQLVLLDAENNLLDQGNLSGAFVTLTLQLNGLGDPLGGTVALKWAS